MKKIACMFFLVAVVAASCNSKADQGKINDQYESGREAIEKIEKKNPERFLLVSSKDKKNLLGQTVIKGTIINRAKIVTYKDVDIKLQFFSKTGTLLEEDREVIFETVSPGSSKNFKTKYFAAKGTDSVAMKIMTAKIAE